METLPTTPPPADGCTVELGWLREQLAKFEKSLSCREQMAQTISGGTDASWRKVAKMCGGPMLTKAKRAEMAARDRRIAAKDRRDVKMCKAVIALVEASQPNIKAQP